MVASVDKLAACKRSVLFNQFYLPYCQAILEFAVLGLFNNFPNCAWADLLGSSHVQAQLWRLA